jgi:hypothetical protein
MYGAGLSSVQVTSVLAEGIRTRIIEAVTPAVSEPAGA